MDAPPAGWAPPPAQPPSGSQPDRGLGSRSGWRPSGLDGRGAGGGSGGKRLPTYLLQAIVCAVVFNPLAGVVAIVYGVKVNRKLTVGDWDGAARASRLARAWCWVSVVVGVVFLVLVLSGSVPNPYKG